MLRLVSVQTARSGRFAQISFQSISNTAPKSNAFFVSTPIYYANGAPHLGHLYTSVVADMIARYHRLDGKNVFFTTGTDDHGQKVQQAAVLNNQTPLEFTNVMADKFKHLSTTFDISYDEFVRTTSSKHKVSVHALWKRLTEKGYIYKGMYEGWYSTRDECFYSVDELVIAPPVVITPQSSDSNDATHTTDIASTPVYLSPESGDVVKWVQEESYFFKLSAFSEELLNYYQQHPQFILPKSKANEVISFVKGRNNSNDQTALAANEVVSDISTVASAEVSFGLKDLSISRTSFSWGIPVPVENITPCSISSTASTELLQPSNGAVAADLHQRPEHVIYVWMDALTNYISSLGYDESYHSHHEDKGAMDSKNRTDAKPSMASHWPANVHIIGKDILRFHAIYWPAFLLAAELPLPKCIFAHGWWVVNGVKMSKSLGNVITPESVLALNNHHNTDYVRYYLLSEIVFGNDGDFDHGRFVSRINTGLSNDFGNLIQRVVTMLLRNCQGIVPSILHDTTHPIDVVANGSIPLQQTYLLANDVELLQLAESTVSRIDEHMNSYQIYQIMEDISSLCRACNKYFDAEAPWKLAKSIDNSLTQGDNRLKSVETQRFYTVIYVTVEMIRRLSVLYSAIIPRSSVKILDILQVPASQRTLASLRSTVFSATISSSTVDLSKFLPMNQSISIDQTTDTVTGSSTGNGLSTMTLPPIFPRIFPPATSESDAASKSTVSKKKQNKQEKKSVNNTKD